MFNRCLITRSVHNVTQKLWSTARDYARKAWLKLYQFVSTCVCIILLHIAYSFCLWCVSYCNATFLLIVLIMRDCYDIIASSSSYCVMYMFLSYLTCHLVYIRFKSMLQSLHFLFSVLKFVLHFTVSSIIFIVLAL